MKRTVSTRLAPSLAVQQSMARANRAGRAMHPAFKSEIRTLLPLAQLAQSLGWTAA